MSATTFDEALGACRAMWGEPIVGDKNFVWWPRLPRSTEAGCEMDGVSLGLDDGDVTLIATGWGAGQCYTLGPSMTLVEAIFAVGRWLRERGGDMPRPDPYDPEDMPSRGYDR